MLKLTLKQGDIINIGEDISIQLASDAVYRTNILINAPQDVGIMRAQKDSGEEPRDVRAPKRIIMLDNRRK